MTSQHQRDNNEGQRRDNGELTQGQQRSDMGQHCGLMDQTTPKDALCSGWWVTRGGP